MTQQVSDISLIRRLNLHARFAKILSTSKVSSPTQMGVSLVLHIGISVYTQLELKDTRK